MRLRTRLILLCIALATVPVVIAGAIVSQLGETSLSDKIRLRLTATNDQRHSEINQWLQSNRTLLKAIAERPSLRAAAEQLVALQGREQTPLKETIRREHLAFWPENIGGDAEMRVLDATSGEVLVSSNPRAEGRTYVDEAHFQRALIGDAITPAEFNPLRNSAEVFVAAPIRDVHGRHIAVLAGRLDWNQISEILAVGPPGIADEEAYIVGSDFVALTQTTQMQNLPIVSPPIRRCLAGQSFFGEHDSYAGERVLGAYSWLPKLNACLVTEQTTDAAHAPIGDFRASVVLTAATLVLAASLLGAAFATRMLRPLNLLKNGVESVANGDLGARVGANSADEIGEVSRAFNRMMERLETITASRDELDKEVMLRTQTEQTLRQAEANARALFDGSYDCLLLIDANDLRILDCNAAATTLLGYPREALLTMSISELDSRSTPVDIEERVSHLHAHGHIDFETDLRNIHGEAIPVLVTVQAIEVRGRKCFHAVQRDIRQLKAADRALRKSEQRFRRAITYVPFPVMIHASDGSVLFTSDAWHEYTGFERTDGATVRMWSEGPCAIVTGAEQAWLHERYTLKSPHDEGEIFIRTREGTQRIWHVVTVPLGRLAPQSSVVMTTATDITELKQIQTALLIRNQDLTRSNRELEQFAYVASHDLQEPLRMVAGFTGLLHRRYHGKFDADADRFIEFATDGAQRMQRMINDLLDFSRIRTRAKPFEDVDSRAILNEVLRDHATAIHEAEASITIGDLPVVKADRSQLYRVFQNLISNSLKFRGQTAPQITVTSSQTDSHWEFSVSDNGIGIDPQFFERIFDIFQRLQTREIYPGNGIGLAIAKRIIERHGGTIKVVSTPDNGSTFTFSLAKAPALAETLLPVPTQRNDSTLVM